MLIDPKLSSWVDEHIVCREEIRRLADGSIDYRHYDRRARNLRAESFIRPFALIAAGFRAFGGRWGR